MKTLLSLVSGFVIACGLLFLMTHFIAKPAAVKPEKVEKEPTTIRVQVKEELPTPTTTLPTPPSLSIEPNLESDSEHRFAKQEPSPVIDQTVRLDRVKLLQIDKLGVLNHGDFKQLDSEAVALFQPAASYPIDAQFKGIEGWVKFKYDINEDGSLFNIRLIGSQPGQAFVKEARRAIKKWKFKPAMVNGKPMVVKNQVATLEFELPGAVASN